MNASNIDVRESYTLQQARLDFEMLSKLPPNTWIQLNHGRLEAVAGTYSGYLGTQFAASIYYGYSPEKFIDDFKLHVHHIVTSVDVVFHQGAKTSNEGLKRLRFNELHLTRTSFEKALIGDVEDGGLRGLLKTHAQDAILEDLKNAIMSLRDTIVKNEAESQNWYALDFTQSQFLGTSNKLPYYPEKFFTDSDWQNAIAASAKFSPEIPSLSKQVRFNTSFLGDQFVNSTGTGNLRDKILEMPNGAKLLLGSMPLISGMMRVETRNDLKDLIAENVEAILCVTEVFEKSEGYYYAPISAEQWATAGIKYLHIPTPDRQTITIENLLRGAAFINWCLLNKISILVHCKAGMSRSALMVMCYLIQYHNYTADAAFEHVHKCRIQAFFKDESDKMHTLKEFDEKVNAAGQWT